MTKHYVEFIYAETFVSETGVNEIPNRDHPIKLPQGAYGWTIYDREEIWHEGELLVGTPKNRGPRHIVGEKFTLDRVKREIPDSRMLQSKMECNRWPFVIKCRQEFIPGYKGDVVIDPKRD